MIRQLTSADWPAMSLLRLQQPNHAGASVDSFTANPLVHVSSKYKTAPHAAFGYFEDGALCAFICCAAGDDFWVLDLMISSKGNPGSLREILSACLAHYEAKGIYQFFYAFPKKWARAYRSFWKDGSELLRKYEIEDIDEVVAYKVPSPWVMENILYGSVVPVNLLVRRSRCSTRM